VGESKMLRTSFAIGLAGLGLVVALGRRGCEPCDVRSSSDCRSSSSDRHCRRRKSHKKDGLVSACERSLGERSSREDECSGRGRRRRRESTCRDSSSDSGCGRREKRCESSSDSKFCHSSSSDRKCRRDSSSRCSSSSSRRGLLGSSTTDVTNISPNAMLAAMYKIQLMFFGEYEKRAKEEKKRRFEEMYLKVADFRSGFEGSYDGDLPKDLVKGLVDIEREKVGGLVDSCKKSVTKKLEEVANAWGSMSHVGLMEVLGSSKDRNKPVNNAFVDIPAQIRKAMSSMYAEQMSLVGDESGRRGSDEQSAVRSALSKNRDDAVERITGEFEELRRALEENALIKDGLKEFIAGENEIYLDLVAKEVGRICGAMFPSGSGDREVVGLHRAPAAAN